jgi:hypothetical protein
MGMSKAGARIGRLGIIASPGLLVGRYLLRTLETKYADGTGGD